MEFDSSNRNFQKLKELSLRSDDELFYRNVIGFGVNVFGKYVKVRIKKSRIIALHLDGLRKIKPTFQEDELVRVQQRDRKRRRFTIFFNLTRWGTLGKNWVRKGLVKSEKELRLQLAMVILYSLFQELAPVFDEDSDFVAKKILGCTYEYLNHLRDNFLILEIN